MTREPAEIALDPGCTVRPDPYLRWAEDNRTLIGGSPSTITRLTEDGARMVVQWFAGSPVGSSTAAHRLARRLERSGQVFISWPPVEVTAAFDVVIPVKDDPLGLQRTLESLQKCGAQTVIVVDDGSTVPIAASAIPYRDLDYRVLRHEQPFGPGRARQSGLEQVAAPIVLFVDAGVTVEPATVDQLRQAFDDPLTVAAGPRVRSRPGPGLVARYELRRSPLDLGPDESLVGPGRLVPYLPTACLMVRSSTVVTQGGFDLALRYGEDVDLVWRLGRIGHVRYLPGIDAWHPPRPTLAMLAAQRAGYHSAATPLAQRHTYRALAPSRISWWTLTVLVLLLDRRPVSGLLTGTAAGFILSRRLHGLPNQRVEGLLAGGRRHWYQANSVAAASLRAWFPLLVLALAFPGPLRGPIRRLVVAGVLRRLADRPRTGFPKPSAGDYALDLGIGLVDDLASCAGIWRGAWRAKALPPIGVQLTNWLPPARKARSTQTGRST